MSETDFTAVLMGGTSSEREVSLSSGKACASALREAGHRVAMIDVGPDIAEKLAQIRPTRVFNALHGAVGEDGKIQGLLEILRIPYTHSGVAASALAMNKVLAKQVAQANGVDVTDHQVLAENAIMDASTFSFPCVVKPVSEGSSLGVRILKDESDAKDITSYLDSLECDVMVESYIPGRELTCSVLNGRVLGVTEIITDNSEFYDFQSKYSESGSTHICPANISRELFQRVADASVRVHNAFGCRGATRSDFRYDEKTDRLIWLEVNTQPGMTPTSLLPEMAMTQGITFGDLVSILLEDASIDR